jgi:hypothetical protein
LLPFLRRLLCPSATTRILAHGLAEARNQLVDDLARVRIEDLAIGWELLPAGRDTHDINPPNSRETCQKSVMGEKDDGSRFEVRGVPNFEPGTSNFVSSLLHAVRFPMVR